MTANTAAEIAQDIEASDAMTHVREVVAKSGTSFLWGMRILPRARRDAMYAIYAFCREVDDIADEPNPRETKLRRLAEWRGEIARLYEGAPREPVAQALLGPVAAFDLPSDEFLAVIDGMEMDVCSQIVAPSMDDYALYCRRVAGAVGLLSIRVFGDVSAPARELAVVLGEGLQTINILRDLDEDAGRGRLYLPGDLLAKHGMADLSPDAVLAHPNLPAVCEEMTSLAKTRLQRARALLSQCERRRMRPARLMLESYERILHRLEARGWTRPRERVRLSRPEKLWVAFRYSLF
jgi:phytoene synthase